MEFEDILKEVGSYGPFQRNLLYFFCAPLYFLGSSLTMSLIFVVAVPDHWCRLPPDSNVTALRGACTMLLNHSSVLHDETNDTTRSAECPYGWEYDRRDFEATAATQFDMVCERSHYPSLVLTLQNAGGLIGTPISGALADRFGRKGIMFAAVLLMGLTEVGSILAPNFYLFVLLRAINGLSLTPIFVLPFILASELVAPEKRVNVSGIANGFWTIGMCALPLTVYLTRTWIRLGIFNALAAAFILLYWRYVPESPVWLITRERYDEALQIMKQIGKRNGIEPDDLLLTKMLQSLGDRIKKKREEERRNSCSSILRYPALRKIFLILTFCWVADFTSYMGLQYNVTNLEGNIFLNFFLLSVIEAPGTLLFWVLMERVGRRWSAALGYFATSLAILMYATGLPYCEIVSCVIGKLILTGTFMVTDQQACELYPTASRSFFMGISKFFAKSMYTFTPYLIYLGRYGKAIPFLVMGLLCLLSGVFAIFLPETLNKNLPQNASDLENFRHNQKFFSFNRKKQETDAADPPALQT